MVDRETRASDPRSRADTQHALYMRMETVLRTATREALLNADFAAIFAEDESIQREWPLPAN